MADPPRLPHIFLRNTAQPDDFAAPQGRLTKKRLPVRDPERHAEKLLRRLDLAREAAEEAEDATSVAGIDARDGIYLEFLSEPGHELAWRSMESGGIRLLNVRKLINNEGQEQFGATVFVPKGKLRVLERKLEKFASEVTEKKGRPKNEDWAAPIADIRHAALRAFWTDAPEELPHLDQRIWWEVWLLNSVERSGPETVSLFRERARFLDLEVGQRSLHFPERIVLLVYGTRRQLARSTDIVDSIAELRKARELPSEYMNLSAREMGDWAEDLRERLIFPDEGAPSICILDTGVNREHRLIEPYLEEADCHAVEQEWGTDDHAGHGTEMAGVVLFGDVAEALRTTGPVEPPAVLESVKILPRVGENPRELWGAVTERAVARVEIEAPARRRNHMMAVTATVTRDRGRPSSWSGAVDQLAAGVDGERRRLMIVSAGNSRDDSRSGHPDHLDTAEIHDPGQAWNALTVGAATHKWHIDEEELNSWEPVAEPGDLSPATTTSILWDHRWPLKPDIVLEGGNYARDGSDMVVMPDSLGLLTTYFRPAVRPFAITGDTSAACAGAARLAAAVQSGYPEFWPETVRALLVHSARWTPQMLTRFGPFRPRTPKKHYVPLLRSCGFGIPTLDRLLWSAANRLTLILQNELQPFAKKLKTPEGRKSYLSEPQFREMHFHQLPWPKEQLLELGEQDVVLRVTLSYFIEPSPGERGWDSRYRYSSHGLRFDVRGIEESPDDFRKRLKNAARAEGEKGPRPADQSGWTLGPELRHRGSIHSDVWRGSAANLATREEIGIYPIGGWWKERKHLGRWNRKARYALIVSIEAPEIEVDLYTPVAAQVGIPIEV